jgi:hypothetical protein
VGGNLENSPVNIINKTVNNQDPAVLAAMAKTFADQMAATTEARAKAEAKAAELAQKLGFTASAVAEFFKILGEQNVPEKKIPARLVEIATHFAQTRSALAALTPDDPHAAELARSASSALDAGRLAEADNLLGQAKEMELAAFRQARELKQKAQEAEDQHALNAAKLAGGQGEIALTQLRFADAAQHFKEATTLVPAGHPAQSALYTSGFGDALLSEGHPEEAENPLKAALKLYRDLVMEDPDKYRSYLADVLQALGALQIDIGRLPDAEKSLTEELTITRALAARNPQSYQETLAGNLHALGFLYLETSQFADAETASVEGLTVSRALAAYDPHRSEVLVENLDTLGKTYFKTGRFADAEKSLTEELTIARALAADDPQRYQGQPLGALGILALLYANSDRAAEAEKAIREALLILGNSTTQDRLTWVDVPVVAWSLEYIDPKELYNAENLYREAITVWRSFAARDDAYIPDFAALLNHLSNLYFDILHEPGEAEKLLTEAVTVWHDYLSRNPNASRDALAGILMNLVV